MVTCPAMISQDGIALSECPEAVRTSATAIGPSMKALGSFSWCASSAAATVSATSISKPR